LGRALPRDDFSGLADMTEPTGAGVLELLRLFRKDQTAGDRYAAACLKKVEAVEPVLQADIESPATARTAEMLIRREGSVFIFCGSLDDGPTNGR